MSENALYRAISRATGESFQTIERLGFQPLTDEIDHDGDDPPSSASTGNALSIALRQPHAITDSACLPNRLAA